MSDSRHINAVNGLSLEDAAAYWDSVLRSTNCQPEDRIAFRKWRDSDPDNAFMFNRAQKLIEELESISKTPEIQSLREAALRYGNPISTLSTKQDTYPQYRSLLVKRFRSLTRRPAAIASIAVVFLMSMFFGVNLQRTLNFDQSPNQIEANNQEIYATKTFSTVTGERSTITLVDGSLATLNTNTELVVMYSKGKRLISLIHGEAFFDVAHHPDRPFVVLAAGQQVEALGTEFSVRYLANKVKVSLLEGRVEVGSTTSKIQAMSETKSSFPATTELRPGQQLIATLNDESAVTDVIIRDAEIYTLAAWRQDRIFFDRTRLDEAIAEMNRYNPAQIQIADDKLPSFRISGSYKTGDPEKFLNDLNAVMPISINKPNEYSFVVKSAPQK